MKQRLLIRGVAGVVVALSLAAAGFAIAFVNCPSGTTLKGGGADVLRQVGDADGFGPRILASQPFNPNQWLAEALAPRQLAFERRQLAMAA